MNNNSFFGFKHNHEIYSSLHLLYVPGPPKVTLNNYSPTITIRQTSLNSFTLQCLASYAHPLKPIVWVKDGIYVNNNLPPGGLNLGFTRNGSANQLDIYNTSIPGLLQGYYRCEVWGVGTDRIASNDTLLTFEGDPYFLVSMLSR